MGKRCGELKLLHAIKSWPIGVARVMLCSSINFEIVFLISFENLFFNLNNEELSNYKALKSNKETLIYKPCQVSVCGKGT